MTDTRRCIFAYTAPDLEYPAYMNISIDDSDGRIFLTMRSHKAPAYSESNPYSFNMPGDTTTLELSYEAFAELERGVKDAGLEILTKRLARRS